ncbi:MULTISPECIES: hypothetical protein [Pandoraea]|nr:MULTISPECIES: hypothetical protein [Pandoraea]MBN9095874.1 hypothetical protein [Pandoraea pnomenusa]QDH61284.1 hypothetical protein FKQ53_19850 [Pandoraea pnomenusa]QDX23259.1 hypothetical protein FP568_19915 [Pandoraea pnomenusa]
MGIAAPLATARRGRRADFLETVMATAHFRRPHPTVELARCVFRQHYIRIMQGERPGNFAVLVDIWPMDGRTFTSIDQAKQAAMVFIRNLEND